MSGAVYLKKDGKERKARGDRQIEALKAVGWKVSRKKKKRFDER